MGTSRGNRLENRHVKDRDPGICVSLEWAGLGELCSAKQVMMFVFGILTHKWQKTQTKLAYTKREFVAPCKSVVLG